MTTKRALIFAFLSLLFLAAGFALTDFYRWRQVEQSLRRQLADDFSADIKRGASLKEIALLFEEAGVAPGDFSNMAKHLKADARLRAGRYHFERGTTMRQVLQKIVDGQVIVDKFTIFAGRDFSALLESLKKEPRFASELTKMSAPDIRKKLNIQRQNLEGLFLPETYYFDVGAPDVQLLARAHRAMQKVLSAAWKTRQDDGLFAAPYEALILASIIEKETGKAAERPTIASVFANRLRRGMRLQADPTVIYGLGKNFDGNLTRRHLRADTPYNTYTRNGLPPTPIALPSKEAIVAALNPPPTKFYYFVATGDGGHYFSKTLREHNNAVNRYQRRRK